MGLRYAVLGSGRQGTAAAYDIARFGSPQEIMLADANMGQAESAASRVNALLSDEVARPIEVDASDHASLRRLLGAADVVVSAVPYIHNLQVAEAAVTEGTSMVDLGGNTDIVLKELALDERAREAGVSLVPDCGMGPGMNVTLLVYAMGLLDESRDVRIYVGGLPEDPEPPWYYALTFSIEGLTNEYTNEATFLRDGRIAKVSALEEPEVVEIPPLGRLEARVTSGGLSTAPWTFRGQLGTLEEKTLRYPGHWDRMQAFSDLGLFGTEAIEVDGLAVVPRHVFHTLFEPQVAAGRVRDVAVIRVRVLGTRGGEAAEAVVDLVDRYDEATGFTAMERVTGWHASIVAQMIANGEISPGAHSVESVPAKRVVDEARRRGFSIVETRESRG